MYRTSSERIYTTTQEHKYSLKLSASAKEYEREVQNWTHAWDIRKCVCVWSNRSEISKYDGAGEQEHVV